MVSELFLYAWSGLSPLFFLVMGLWIGRDLDRDLNIKKEIQMKGFQIGPEDIAAHDDFLFVNKREDADLYVGVVPDV